MTAVPDLPDDPGALRDRVALELLYASGVRVAELCGLDVDDVDRERRVIRVFGKGAKERTVPFGLPADAASRPGWHGVAPGWSRHTAGRRCCSGLEVRG